MNGEEEFQPPSLSAIYPMNALNRNIMAIGAHADDIELNIGATLSKYKDRGYGITYVMSTNNMSGLIREVQGDGSLKYHYETPIPMMRRRKKECEIAAKALGAVLIHLDHPQRHYNAPERVYDPEKRDEDGMQTELCYGSALPEGVAANAPTILTAHEHPECVDKLSGLIMQYNPEVIFTHGFIQVNPEHYSTCILTVKSYWKAVEKGYRGSLLLWYEDFEELGLFNSQWETWVEVSGYLDQKIHLLYLHACQFAATNRCPDRDLRIRANKWGRASGGEAAEVFTFVNPPHAGVVQGELEKELRSHQVKIQGAPR